MIYVTSQVKPEGWVALFDDEVIAEAIIDRLTSNSQKYPLKGSSYRKKQAEKIEKKLK